MRYTVILLLVLLSACNSADKTPVADANAPATDSTTQEYLTDTTLVQINTDNPPAFVRNYIDGLIKQDTLHYYDIISLNGYKKVSQAISVIIYTRYTGVGMATFAATFKNGEWFEEITTAQESDEESSHAHYSWTEFETSDTIHFKVTEFTESVKDTSLYDAQGWIKTGRGRDEEETILDSVVTKWQVLPTGNIVQE